MSIMSERVVSLDKKYRDIAVACWDCGQDNVLPEYGKETDCTECGVPLDFDDRVDQTLEAPAWCPTFGDIDRWMNGTENAMALDECEVEPDGRCEHGSPSWIRHLGLI